MASSYVSVCVSECVSVTRWYCIEMAARIELAFANGIPSTLATPCFKEMSPKIRVLPFGTLSETLDLENFGHGASTVGKCDKQRQRSVCC